MITENLSTLQIHKLTEKQFKEAKANGNLDPSAFYLTKEVIGKCFIVAGQSDAPASDGSGIYTLEANTTVKSLEKLAEALAGLANDDSLEYSVKLDSGKYKAGKILAVDTTAKTVKVSNFTKIKFDDEKDRIINYLTVVGHPELGDTEVGFNTSTDGENNIAQDINAHAEGRDTKAIAECAHAEGRETVAGYAAHAEGRRTEATGDNSHAEGHTTKATGAQAHAEGRNTKASGAGAHAEGHSYYSDKLNTASGRGSHAEGMDGTEANGTGSHAEGYGTVASTQAQHAQGRFNLIDTAGTYAHIVGNGHKDSSGNITRSNAHTVDWDGNAWFAGSVTVGAEGELATRAYADTQKTSAIAEAKTYTDKQITTKYVTAGKHSKSTLGDKATAEGGGTYAEGERSHAEGWNTKALAEAAHSEGRESTAQGAYAHAEGYGTQANKDSSHAEGKGTIANGTAQHVGGSYNVADDSSLVIIGNGTSNANRSNAYKLDEDGNGWFAGEVRVGADAKELATSESVKQLEDFLADAFVDTDAKTFSTLTSTSFTKDAHIHKYTKVSDYIPTIEELQNGGTFSCGADDVYTWTADDVAPYYDTDVTRIYAVPDDDDGACAVFIIPTNSTFTDNAGNTPSSGIYLFRGGDAQACGSAFKPVTALTFNPLKHLNAEWAPSTLATKDDVSAAKSSMATALADTVDKMIGRTPVSTQISTAISNIKSGVGQKTADNGEIFNDYTNTAASHAHAEGFSTNALSIESHAEGHATISGTKGFMITKVEYDNQSDNLGWYYLELSDTSTLSQIAVGDKCIAYLDVQSTEPQTIEEIDFENKRIKVDNYYGNSLASSNNDYGITDTLLILNKPWVGELDVGFYSHAEGQYTQAVGLNTHAEGGNTRAVGPSSHAEGGYTHAIGPYSHAEGIYWGTKYDSSTRIDTTANGLAAHAEGQGTQAGGGIRNDGSVAGIGAHSEGMGTVALWDAQHVQGRFNIIDNSDSDYGKYAHIVGNGASPHPDHRSNAHTLDWDGNAWYAGDMSFDGMLIVSEKVRGSDLPPAGVRGRVFFKLVE